MNKVLHCRLFRCINKPFALAQHIDTVTCEQKRPINSLQGRF
jgi:hypothetical protein